MTDPLQLMLQGRTFSTPLFPVTSRYFSIETAMLTMPDGKTVIYLKRRFLPLPENFALLQEHVVTEGERLDNITAHYLGDPEQFWQVCDANWVMRPDELTETPGRRVLITLPQGIPGVSDA